MSASPARLTYRGGAGGLGNPAATLTDCPLCRQAARVDLHGERLSVRCYGECAPDAVLASLDVARIAGELRRAS